MSILIKLLKMDQIRHKVVLEKLEVHQLLRIKIVVAKLSAAVTQ